MHHWIAIASCIGIFFLFFPLLCIILPHSSSNFLIFKYNTPLSLLHFLSTVSYSLNLSLTTLLILICFFLPSLFLLLPPSSCSQLPTANHSAKDLHILISSVSAAFFSSSFYITKPPSASNHFHFLAMHIFCHHIILDKTPRERIYCQHHPHPCLCHFLCTFISGTLASFPAF